jgi:nucleoside-diphosphate-sugar epimerase
MGNFSETIADINKANNLLKWQPNISIIDCIKDILL